MPETNNTNFFQRFKQNDEAAFSQLFNEYYPALCFFCMDYVKDLDLARSLVQQVFVDLWIKREKLTIKYSIKPYLYNAVKNKAIDHLRQQKHTVRISENVTDLKEVPFQDLVQESETLQQINNSINQLPEKCKEIFLLCRFEGMKYKQIAEKLNISIKTVEMQMSIALKRIREKLTDNKSINLFLSFFSKK